MFNLIKDEFDENIDDIMNTVNKIINEKENKDIETQNEKTDNKNKM